NDGTFSVSGVWSPNGVVLDGGSFSNAGAITVSGLNGAALALSSSTAVTATNSGTIDVSGPTAEAFDLWGGGSLTNSGTITATSPSGASFGVIAGNQTGGSFTIDN